MVALSPGQGETGDQPAGQGRGGDELGDDDAQEPMLADRRQYDAHDGR